MISQWNNNNVGRSGTDDKGLGADASGHFYFDVFTASHATATGTTVATVGKLYHVVGTYDGVNVRIFVNGHLEGSAATTGSSYTGYTTPFLVLAGGSGVNAVNDGAGSSGQGMTGVLLLHNYANVGWSAPEVTARYDNPFGFLIFPEDVVAARLKGQLLATAGVGAIPYDTIWWSGSL